MPFLLQCMLKKLYSISHLCNHSFIVILFVFVHSIIILLHLFSIVNFLQLYFNFQLLFLHLTLPPFDQIQLVLKHFAFVIQSKLSSLFKVFGWQLFYEITFDENWRFGFLVLIISFKHISNFKNFVVFIQKVKQFKQILLVRKVVIIPKQTRCVRLVLDKSIMNLFYFSKTSRLFGYLR